MDEQNKNLLLATGLSFVVLLVWMAFFAPEPPAEGPATDAQITEQTDTTLPTAQQSDAPATPGSVATPEETRTAALTDAPRVQIDTPRLEGSISLYGGRIDDLKLRDYRETTDDEAPIVTLLSPEGVPGTYYAAHGWAQGAGLNAEDVPGPDTTWTLASGDTLSPGSPVVLSWDSPAGLTFQKTISIDDNYMFSIEQSVTNATDETKRLAPYGLIRRHGIPEDLKGFFILHEGLVRMTDGELNEVNYDDIADLEAEGSNSSGSRNMKVESNGWIGFTDHYWMTTLVPAPGAAFTSTQWKRLRISSQSTRSCISPRRLPMQRWMP